jgi:hypothetical protein
MEGNSITNPVESRPPPTYRYADHACTVDDRWNGACVQQPKRHRLPSVYVVAKALFNTVPPVLRKMVFLYVGRDAWSTIALRPSSFISCNSPPPYASCDVLVVRRGHVVDALKSLIILVMKVSSSSNADHCSTQHNVPF